MTHAPINRTIAWMTAVVAALTLAGPARSADPVVREKAKESAESVRKHRRQLWRTSVESIGGGQNKNAALAKALANFRSMRPNQKTDKTPHPKVQVAVPTRRAAQSPGKARTPAVAPSAKAPAKPVLDVSAEVLAKLAARAPEDPKWFVDFADALYRNGRRQEATGIYAAALKAKQTDDDRAWTVFQLANCLRVEDPARARATYARLLTEAPNSAWAPAARARMSLLEWYGENDPNRLIRTWVIRRAAATRRAPTSAPVPTPAAGAEAKTAPATRRAAGTQAKTPTVPERK